MMKIKEYMIGEKGGEEPSFYLTEEQATRLLEIAGIMEKNNILAMNTEIIRLERALQEKERNQEGEE